MTKTRSMTGPKGRRAILFQRAVQNSRRRQAAELPPPAEPLFPAGAGRQQPVRADGANDMKAIQARLEAAYDGADAA